MAKKTFQLCTLFFFIFFLVVMPLYAAGDKQEHKGGLLDIHPGLGVWTILTFVVLAVILKKFAWKPLLHAIEEREKNIQDAIQNSEKSQKEAMEFVEESKKNLSKSKEDASEIIQKAQQKAALLRKEALLATEKECAEIKYNTQKEIQDLQNSFFFSQIVLMGDLGLEIASSLLHRSLNKDDHKKLLEESIERIQKKMEAKK